MPVVNCCLGCQGPMNTCGGHGGRYGSCCSMGPNCVHSVGACCSSPCGDRPGCMHGARGGLAASYFSCGHGCIGGCTSGLCASCCGPRCG